MNIKKISDYNESEIQIAKTYSSAINRYLSILDKKHDDTSYNKIILKRHTHWIESALAQIHSTSTSKDICKYWSQKTNEILNEVWSLIPGNDEIALFALGKLGANELNLSSDIDILLVSLRPATKEQFKFYRKFNEFLSQHSELGFCYRLDFNLRPGGRLGPTICSTQQFEDYYWTQGATWERVALNRLSPICGNTDVINNVTQVRDKFCYRKFIDYRLINDIKNIRSHIHAQDSQSNDINIKLGVGGIRDIELYINSLQVIHGGKLPQLKTSETSEAVNKLCQSNIIPGDEGDFLKQTYWKYREIENLLQIKDDQQTHTLNKNSELFINNQAELPFTKVNSIVANLIGEKPQLQPLLPAETEQQLTWLNKLGFDTKLANNIWPKLMRLTVLAKDNQLDEIFRSRFLFNFISNVSEFGLDKNLSLNLLFDFIKSIRPKRSFYHLLEQEPNIVKELAIILSSSPYLGNLISSKPELLDSFLLKKTQSFSLNLDELHFQLGDYKQLNQLLVSSQFLTNKTVTHLTDICSITADKICNHLLLALKNKFKNNSIDIIKLGKWGGAELGLLSDLDFIFITDDEISDDDIKISRRFINFLTNRQQGGEVYKTDMRLRPQSGTGTVITTKAKLINYIINEAKPWEAQSYLKSAPLINSSFRVSILDALLKKSFPGDFVTQLTDIKNQVIKENFIDTKKNENSIDFKYSSGGLVDIEFTLQIHLLKNKISPVSPNTLSMLEQVENSSKLKSNYLKLRYYEQASQILSQNNTTLIDFSDKNFARLSRHLQMSYDDMEHQIRSLLSDNVGLLELIV